jgi:hypothetical protein
VSTARAGLLKPRDGGRSSSPGAGRVPIRCPPCRSRSAGTPWGARSAGRLRLEGRGPPRWNGGSPPRCRDGGHAVSGTGRARTPHACQFGGRRPAQRSPTGAGPVRSAWTRSPDVDGARPEASLARCQTLWLPATALADQVGAMPLVGRARAEAGESGLGIVRGLPPLPTPTRRAGGAMRGRRHGRGPSTTSGPPAPPSAWSGRAETAGLNVGVPGAVVQVGRRCPRGAWPGPCRERGSRHPCSPGQVRARVAAGPGGDPAKPSQT